MTFDLAARFRAVIEEKGGSPAVEWGGRWRAWREIGRIVAAYDAAASQHGLTPGMRVGFVARNSPAHLGALMAALANRATVVLINSSQDGRQVARDLIAAQPDVLIAADFKAALEEASGVTGALPIAIEEDEAGADLAVLGRWRGASVGAPDPVLAVQLLTSGTTGPPKRVNVTYDGLAATTDAAWRIDVATAGGDFPAPRWAAGSMGHVGGFVNACTLASRGHPMLMREKFSLAEWTKAVADHGLVMSTLPPAAIRMVMASDVPADNLASLRAIRTGSAPISDDLKRAVEDRFGVPVLSAYGATEYCGTIAFWSLEEHRRFGGAKPGAVGRVIRGVADVRVIDPNDGRELALGETGVLEARVERMGEKWIRTNDLAKLDADDFLYILGRVDRVINRGGFKISPEALEETLRAHGAVADAAVLAVPDERLGEAPMAAVELKPGAKVSEDELLAFLRERVVRYHIPLRVVVLPQLPRTPALKVATHVLREQMLRS